LKQGKVYHFILVGVLLITAALYLELSFNRYSFSIQFASGQDSVGTSFSPQTDDTSLLGYPLSSPAPALVGEKGGSLRQSINNKFLNQFIPSITENCRSVFSSYKKGAINLMQHPLRLHLAFCVFRI